MITGKVSKSPRKAYFNMPGKSLSSNLGGSTIDGTGIDVDDGEGSTLGLYRLVSMMRTKSNNAFTSSIDFSISKFIPKWAKYFSKGSLIEATTCTQNTEFRSKNKDVQVLNSYRYSKWLCGS